ncbi:hypothetical protein D9M70_367480 [compost metagenome]
MPGSNGLSDHPIVRRQRPGVGDQPGHVLVRHLELAALNHAGLQVLEAIGLRELSPIQRRSHCVGDQRVEQRLRIALFQPQQHPVSGQARDQVAWIAELCLDRPEPVHPQSVGRQHLQPARDLRPQRGDAIGVSIGRAHIYGQALVEDLQPGGRRMKQMLDFLDLRRRQPHRGRDLIERGPRPEERESAH